MIDKNPLEEPFLLDGEFGWEHKKIHNFHDKLCYLLIGILYYDQNKLTNTYKKLKNYLDEIYGYDVNIPKYYKHTYNDAWCYKYNNCNFTNGGYYYIDHGHEIVNCGFIDYVLESKDNLISYLFNTESNIETGNDNDGTFEWWYGSNPYHNFDERFQVIKHWCIKDGETEEEAYNRLKEDDDVVYRVVPEGFVEFYKGN